MSGYGAARIFQCCPTKTEHYILGLAETTG
jgi:hypothetical protein